MKVGYARVSTDAQNLNLQLDALERAGCKVIYQDEGMSGITRERPALNAALDAIQSGDTLVTWKLDRLGRSLSHLISLVADLERRNVAFASLSEAINTRTASGRLLFHVMGALAEFERSLIAERTRAGLVAAQARGKKLGRPFKLSIAQIQSAVAVLAADQARLPDVAQQLDVSPSTLIRAIARVGRHR